MAEYSEPFRPVSPGRNRSDTMAELRSRLEHALRGRYTVEREVGRGGMAIVYLAHDLRLERDVALKVLRPELAVTLGPDRFLQEIRVAAGLAHPHILPLHDSGEAAGCLYYVMPFCTGESLRERLEREHTLPMAEALRFAREVADALDYAHRAGVVHRDIKPENILLQDGHAVVADFGIARAISAAGAQRLTTVGMAVGTREYMSPEQAAGSQRVDGRSDIYSLGCMLFEMLTGSPPTVGTPPEGTTAGRGRTRYPDRGAEIRALRPSVPLEVAGVVARMLARDPGERFQTAGELADALAAPTGVWTPRSVLAERRRRWGAGVITVVGLSAAVLVPRFLRAGLNPLAYIVVPVTAPDSQSGGSLAPDDAARLLGNALGRWTDLRIAGELEWRDWLRGKGVARPSLETTFEYAQGSRAAHLLTVRSEAVGGSDSVEVTAQLFDGGSRRPGVTQQRRFATHDRNLNEEFSDLAVSLLFPQAPPAALSGGSGTHVFNALKAYVDGHAALTEWNLDSALHAFRTAAERDRAFPHASLWLAQTLEWSGADRVTWRPDAERAAAAGDTLSPYEQLLAEGLAGMAREQFPAACDKYREIVRQNPRDFAGWFGLGECQARDSLVVRDSTSPSHWRFESSYEAAVQAYRSALTLVPSANRAFGVPHGRLVQFTESNELRYGFALDPDTVWFAAFPGFDLDHDTLVFVPYQRAIALGRARPPTAKYAVVHNREVVRDITATWVRNFPDDPEACEAHAAVLEDMGDLDGQPEENSALAMVRRARRLTGDSTQAIRLVVAEARLLTKLENFAGARRLADSILVAHPEPTPGEAVALAGLAALTGHVNQAAQLLSVAAPDTLLESGGREFRIRPVPLARAVFALHVYAAFGAPRDSIDTLAHRVDRLVDASFEAPRRDSMQRLFLAKPRAWAFPQLGTSPPERDHPMELQQKVLWALAHGNTDSVRIYLDSLRTMRVDLRPGDVAITYTFLESRVLLAIGDSAAAAQLLGRSLAALSTLGSGLLDNVDQAATLVRAMALRARLADLTGDVSTARRWAGAVLELWAGADDTEQETMQEMRRLEAK
jgi:tetratricopeptide (TPR) repeat protein